MESSAYEFDSLTDLPPLPEEYKPTVVDYSRSFDSLPPFPPSDFTFSDHYLDSSLSLSDSLFLDSTLSLLNRHHLSESPRLDQNLFYEPIRFDQLFPNNDSSAAAPFLHLPDLKSIEQTTTTAVEEPTLTTMKLFPSLSPPPAAKRHKKLHSSTNSSTTSGSPTASSSHNTNDGGRNKRKKISNKIRTLEKLMPWERKMSLAAILEEAHKYIKFLQAQIASLLWMPLESVYNTVGEVGESDLLKSLTRQQILQVLANSPGSRNVLSTHGLCVFSYEQLLTLKAMTRNL
ncbi:PREDICTED: transcription factor bHLH117-like [Camelina sativa]|uniref:Transcription factor bHLH117-like n=1 Tax=Camelina sativa TaxID=90675 RepID=A0ABM0XMR1_CAMSA|nr:PREDICTED: transcription factor bHLH117-like [Camelina sativa]